MHKNLFGIAAILFGVAAVFHSLPSSHAQDFGPVVTGGEQPWLTFSGSLGASATADVYTTPADRVFVVTGACSEGSDIHLRTVVASTTSTVVDGQSNAMRCSTSAGASGFLGAGRGHVVFEPGSIVQVRNAGGTTRRYTVNGYLAAP